MTNSWKKLIVNADDFGFTRGVNEGILRAHEKGIVTATTLMANGAAFQHAVEIAKSTSTLDIGVHLVLWPEGGPMPRRLPSFVGRSLGWSVAQIEAEFCRQVEKIMAAGLVPSHLDTHKHVHMLPWVMKAVARVASRFGIAWVRHPMRPRQVTRYGLRTPDHFTGIRLTGRMNRHTLLHTLARLRLGLTELMCHPGICDDELRRAPTRLREERELELNALASAEVRHLLARMKVNLTSYRMLEAEAVLAGSGRPAVASTP